MRLMLAFGAFLLALAGAFQAIMWAQARTQRQTLRETMRADLNHGSLQALLRARLAGLHLVGAEPTRGEIHAELAFISAVLAHDFGLQLLPEAEKHLFHATHAAAKPADPLVLAAATKMLAMKGGRLSAPSAFHDDVSSESAYLLLAAGHERARAGDLLGAARSYEAALIRAPSFNIARVACAEARLQLADAAGALGLLGPIVKAGNLEARVAVLVARATALASRRPAKWDAQLGKACERDGPRAPLVAARCDLLRAESARSEARSDEALAHVRVGAQQAHLSAGIAGASAQLLAQLGLVDEADALLATGTHADAAEHPALRWARVAIALGRGEAAVVPAGLEHRSAEERLLSARAAFAGGGGAELHAWLQGLGGLQKADLRDLHVLSRLVEETPSPEEDEHTVVATPMRFYVDGLRARLRGDLTQAVTLLNQALEGHGDACRALGELVAALHDSGRPAPPDALLRVQRVNRACVNLDQRSLELEKRRRRAGHTASAPPAR